MKQILFCKFIIILRKKLLNPEFKRFYKINLKRSDILEYILKHNQIELLGKILEDKFYSFNKNHIYSIIIRILKDGEFGDIDTDDM